MSDPLIIKDQFGIIQNLHMFPIPQPSFLVGTLFAASYSKTALDYKITYPFFDMIKPSRRDIYRINKLFYVNTSLVQYTIFTFGLAEL